MYLFRGSKFHDDEGSVGKESLIQTKTSSKQKNIDNNIFTIPNFLARSISRRTLSSPERLPRNNEFDTPSILSRDGANTKRLEQAPSRLMRSLSVSKSNDRESEKTSNRARSTTKRNDWFSDGGSSRGKRTPDAGSLGCSININDFVIEGGGSSRSRSTTKRQDACYDGGSSRSRSTTRRNDVIFDSGCSSNRTTPRRNEAGSQTLVRSTSKRPIMFSGSAGRTKPPPIEKTLECTLEELLMGCKKKVTIARDALASNGTITQEQETMKIKVEPGWRQGTRITFESKVDDRPVLILADVIFTITEARHSLYMREGDDLVMVIEIPLVKALTGCTLSIPLLSGEKTKCRIDDVIYPGYEKIIEGQGMPLAHKKEQRGNLRIRFQVSFPGRLNQQQRSDLFYLLRNCNY